MDPLSTADEQSHSRFELHTLLETSRLLIESHDMDFVLNNLLLITMGKLMISKGLILLYEPWSKSYTVSKTKGKTGFDKDQQLELDWPDQAKDEAVLQACEEFKVPEPLEEQGLCTFFNLRTSNHHIGYLAVGPKISNKELNQHELEFIESLSIISAVAISNSRLIAELKRINRKLDRKVYELNTLFDLSKDFNMLVDRDKIIRIFKFAMLGQMLIRKFFFVLERNGTRKLVTTSGINDEPTQQEINTLFELDDDIVQIDDEFKQDIGFLDRNDIKAIIALRFQNEKMAIVGVGRRANDEEYSQTDFNFLSSLGNLALLSIQKTFLLEERIEKERIEEELNIAKSIQEGLLPSPIPEVEHLDIAARNLSSHQVGGDYFDIVPTPQGNYLFAIADVTGKGIPAALLMANLQAMIHALTPLDITLSEATSRINDIIYQNTPNDKFITFFWGSYTPESSKFRYVNAGHNPPLLFKPDQDKPEQLTEGGLILGAMQTMTPYDEQKLILESDDLLVFYTDGVTEAMNPEEDEEYGEERLLQCLQVHRSESSNQILNAVIDDITAFSGDTQYDDITLIVIRVDE